MHDDYTNLSLVLRHTTSWQHALDLVMSNGSGLLRRPLSNASFLLNFLLFGDSALAFKSVSLALHLLNGGLLYLLATRLTALARPAPEGQTASAPVALAAAMLWLAHPLHTSTVLYVVQRMTQLSACFMLLALYFLARHLTSQDSNGFRSRAWAITAFWLATMLAILSKENGALAPAYALALVALLAHGEVREFLKRHRVVLSATVWAPLAAATLVLCAGWSSFMGGYTYRSFDLDERLASQAVILWKYLGHIIVPLPGRMHFFWDNEPVRSFGDPEVLLSMAAWLLATGLAIWRYRRSPWPLFALAWYLAGHAMESSIIPLELAYEHRSYMPMMGPILAFCVAGARFLRKRDIPLRTAALAAVALLMLGTGVRAFTWSSLPRLIQHEVTTVPQSVRAQYNAHVLAANRRDWPQARHRLELMAAIDPSPDWLPVNLLLMHCQGDPGLTDTSPIWDALRNAASDERTRRGIQQVVNMTAAGSCQRDSGVDFHEMLLTLAKRAITKGNAQIAADYYYMAGSLAWNKGDLDSSARMLRETTKLTPATSGPWEQLVMVHVARGDIAGARRALDRARTIWAEKEPWRLYRYEEWLKIIEERAQAIDTNAEIHPEQPEVAESLLTQ